MIKVGVSGATGNVGRAVCAGIEAAEDLTLVARAAPSLNITVDEILADCDVLVDFTRPDCGLAIALAAMAAGVDVVTGTTGFDVQRLAEGGPGRAFYAPNFAIGAVLMMRFAAEASHHMAAAEIVEMHHDTKVDAPSGTAKHTAEQMVGEVPIHSVRLPGLVAHQAVVLGDMGQTLTIRHDSTDRSSFVPGVLLAVRSIGTLPDRLTIGLERLLPEVNQ